MGGRWANGRLQGWKNAEGLWVIRHWSLLFLLLSSGLYILTFPCHRVSNVECLTASFKDRASRFKCPLVSSCLGGYPPLPLWRGFHAAIPSSSSIPHPASHRLPSARWSLYSDVVRPAAAETAALPCAIRFLPLPSGLCTLPSLPLLRACVPSWLVSQIVIRKS